MRLPFASASTALVSARRVARTGRSPGLGAAPRLRLWARPQHDPDGAARQVAQSQPAVRERLLYPRRPRLGRREQVILKLWITNCNDLG